MLVNNTPPRHPTAAADEYSREPLMQEQDQLVPEPGLCVDTEQRQSDPLPLRKEAVRDSGATPEEPAGEEPTRATQVSEEYSAGRPQRMRKPPKWYNPADY